MGSFSIDQTESTKLMDYCFGLFLYIPERKHKTNGILIWDTFLYTRQKALSKWPIGMHFLWVSFLYTRTKEHKRPIRINGCNYIDQTESTQFYALVWAASL